MSKIISGSQTGSESRMQVISRADFQPGLRMLPFVMRIDMVADIEPAPLPFAFTTKRATWKSSSCCLPAIGFAFRHLFQPPGEYVQAVLRLVDLDFLAVAIFLRFTPRLDLLPRLQVCQLLRNLSVEHIL